MSGNGKNPIYDLLKYSDASIDAIIVQNNAFLRTLIELQIRQMSESGKPIDEIRKEVKQIFDEKFKEVIDNIPKSL